nr:hypothetical protein [Candidatus Sigynarchaeota archaeon]
MNGRQDGWQVFFQIFIAFTIFTCISGAILSGFHDRGGRFGSYVHGHDAGHDLVEICSSDIPPPVVTVDMAISRSDYTAGETFSVL